MTNSNVDPRRTFRDGDGPLPSSFRVRTLLLSEPSEDDASVGVVLRVNLFLASAPFAFRLWLMGNARDGFRLEQPGVDDEGYLRVDPSPFSDEARRAIHGQVFRCLEDLAPRSSWHELPRLDVARTRRQREEDRGW